MRSLVGQTSRFAIWAVLAAGISLPALAQSEDAGFGKDIPLGMAVKRLVPPGTDVRIAPGVNKDAKVTWDGGGWQDALGGAARGAGYAVSVKGNKVEITKSGSAVVSSESTGEAEAGALGTERTARAVRRAERREARVERREIREERREAREERAWRRPHRLVRAPAPRRERHVEVAAAESVSGGGFVMLPVRREAPPVAKAAWREPGPVAAGAPAGPVSGLVVQEGDNLQAVLSAWSQANGWRMQWNSEFSYRLTAAARFNGGFVESTTELLKSMRAVRPLVTATFYQGNKTLVVGNESSDGAAQ